MLNVGKMPSRILEAEVTHRSAYRQYFYINNIFWKQSDSVRELSSWIHETTYDHVRKLDKKG